VGEETTFKVHTLNAGEAEPKVLILGPGGVNEKFTVKKVTYLFSYQVAYDLFYFVLFILVSIDMSCVVSTKYDTSYLRNYILYQK